jgi:hypothetical protein
VEDDVGPEVLFGDMVSIRDFTTKQCHYDGGYRPGKKAKKKGKDRRVEHHRSVQERSPATTAPTAI